MSDKFRVQIEYGRPILDVDGLHISIGQFGIIIPLDTQADDATIIKAIHTVQRLSPLLTDLLRLRSTYDLLFEIQRDALHPDIALQARQHYTDVWGSARKLALDGDIAACEQLRAQSDLVIGEWIDKLNTALRAGRVVKPRKIQKEPLPPRTGFIYLIQSANSHLYKIGKTTDISNRMQMFAVKLPFHIDLIHTITSDDYNAAERKLHEKYADKRVKGEWFELTEKDVAQIKKIKRM